MIQKEKLLTEINRLIELFRHYSWDGQTDYILIGSTRKLTIMIEELSKAELLIYHRFDED